ncbi:hypothetical protein LK09_07995 [Microbacterium mangrovi]|uniref:AMP-dependent synthetase n=1 Tax=Microbacterium mangrovi TaxID=1348253 RepID=A0A0B2ABS8_9MICO|nr:hypothetical protein LK09_07995 [Microbacterium mangrovi]
MRGLSMPAALDRAAEQHGDRRAIVHVEGGGPNLTWSEFRTRVSQLRSGLQRLGVRAGDKVGVQLRNQVEFPLTWFALAELGAAIVPMNPGYTEREAEFVLTDSEARWLIAADDVLAAYSDGEVGPVLRQNIIGVAKPGEPGPAFDSLLNGDILPLREYPDHDTIANIQFTSGTTGLPKGCLLTHRYWVELGVWGSGFFDVQRILADHPFFYMQNQMYLMSALAGGGAIYVTAGLSRRKFMGWLVDHQIDLAWLSEGMLEFPESPDDSALALKRAPVDGMPPEAIAAVETRFGLLARDTYGSTELGVGIAVPWDRPDLAARGSMGFCFPTRESKIVDENLRELPPGEAGELCVRGEGLMLGYHNRPEVNAELLLPGGWFRTGDLVRKDEEGAHYFIGRLKDIIRRSGENISAAEVEQQLMAMPDVAEAAVIPVPDADRGEEVKALIVLRPGAEVTAETIVAHARNTLARFKVPRFLEFRDELPHTGSGKVRKAELKSEDPINTNTLDVLLLGS